MERKATLTPAEARRAAGNAAELLARDRRILLVYVVGSTLDTRRARVGDVDLGVLASQTVYGQGSPLGRYRIR